MGRRGSRSSRYAARNEAAGKCSKCPAKPERGKLCDRCRRVNSEAQKRWRAAKGPGWWREYDYRDLLK